MIHKTKGIALSYVKYRESSVVAKIYTKRFGLQGYVVNGVRSAKSKKGLAHFQPLTLLDLVVYHRPAADLHRISEYKVDYAYSTIPFDPKKMTMAMFLVEFLSKVMKDEEEQGDQFDFVYHSMEVLDRMPSQFENFHLQFILKLSRYLGHGIISYDDLVKNASYTPHSHVGAYLNGLLQVPYDQFIESNGKERSEVLRLLLMYFKTHYDHWSDLKSLNVLGEVFH